jgi:hypothetical protein
MNQSTHGLEGRRRQAADALLRLVSRDELRELGTHLGVPDVGVDSVLDHLARLPRFQALSIVLTIAEPTLRMLREVLTYLESRGVATRTTGCALVLADPVQGQQYRIDLTPQEVGAISAWTSKSTKRLRDDSFGEALADWRSLTSPWRRLLQRARPNVQEGDLDVVETYIAMRSGSTEPVYERDRDLTDHSAQGVLHVLLNRVMELADLLERLPAPERPPSCQALLQEMRDLIRIAGRDVFRADLRRRRRGYPSTHSPARGVANQRALLRYVDQRFLDTLDRLAEDLYLLADLLAGDHLFDVLGIDVWTSRPQLYEVWLLVSVLSWFEARGYRIELLKIEPGQGGRLEWRLAYAKDLTPCARVRGGQLKDGGIYYQLYRESGDMPDLCLLPEPSTAAKPYWAIDAKHSEMGSYALAAYRATATRYRHSFGADLSLVVEYFARPELVEASQNPLHFETGVFLVTDASPEGRGLPIALNLLHSLHPPLACAVLCIDLSDSFRQRAVAALTRARARLRSAGSSSLDSFVCFADRAATRTGMKAFVDGDVDNPPNLGDVASVGRGTQLPPVINELRALVARTSVSELVLVSDGAFSGTGDALHVLAGELGIPVTLCS